MEPAEYRLDDDTMGKKRKHTAWMSNVSELAEGSLFHCYYNVSTDGKVSLNITNQPERQHRARYQTEGSRGAVKDRSQSGFPVVELRGYDNTDKLATLQVFIGNDIGTPIPHIHYQACRVTGKNLTPCQEMKKEGTDVILIDFEPEKGNRIVCDCVGILKERHSDIEGKMAKQKQRTNWKKKSTKCRMVFRVEVELDNGKTEILQVVSDPISCTQLPGTPEILKMSLNSCDPGGGEELWMIGKNFMKDSVVTFQDSDRSWVRTVQPNKDFFNATHLIATVPAYYDQIVTQPLPVFVTVTCVGKTSEPHTITFVPGSNVGSERMQENGLRFSNIFNPMAASTRPTILEPIDGTVVPAAQQMESQAHSNETKPGPETMNPRPMSFCDEESSFEFPLIQHRPRTNGLASNMSGYRIQESIADESSLPEVSASGLQDEESVTSPASLAIQAPSTFQHGAKIQRLNFSGMLNPQSFNHQQRVESGIGVFGSVETPIYSIPLVQPGFSPGQTDPSKSEKCNISFDKPGTENATISIKLPPSVLENQEQLGTIVNTINKALTLTRETHEPEKPAQVLTTSTISQTTGDMVSRNSDWSNGDDKDGVKKQRRVSSKEQKSAHIWDSPTEKVCQPNQHNPSGINFLNPCILNEAFNSVETLAPPDHGSESGVCLQPQQQQQQHIFIEHQNSFEEQPHNDEEPAKKPKVVGIISTDSLVWDPPSEKPVVANDQPNLLSLANNWQPENTSLISQISEANFVSKAKANDQSQQGLWHFSQQSSLSNDGTPSVVQNEDNNKWETIDAKPMTDEIHQHQNQHQNPTGLTQGNVLTQPDWTAFLAPADKSDKWLQATEDKSSPGWVNAPTNAILSTQPLPPASIPGEDVSNGLSESPEMVPVNPKDIVLIPSPMEVDSYIYRNQTNI